MQIFFAFLYRIRIFASHWIFRVFTFLHRIKKSAWPRVLIIAIFLWILEFSWALRSGTKVYGDLKLLPNRSTRLLVQSHVHLSNKKRVQLGDANAKTQISNANANANE